MGYTGNSVHTVRNRAPEVAAAGRFAAEILVHRYCELQLVWYGFAHVVACVVYDKFAIHLSQSGEVEN